MPTLSILHTEDLHAGSVDTALVAIPGGQFVMGSPDTDTLALEGEKPAHPVRLSAFQCMKYPVTQRLWVAVMDGEREGWRGTPADDRPVSNASWYDAARFCNQLSQRAGLTPCYRFEGADVRWTSSEGFRLPTEAEWEYACRAGTLAPWNTGEDERELEAHAWYAGSALQAPQPVGRKQANAWGLHDMHGNVWEWCWDRYAPYPAPDRDAPSQDPHGPEPDFLGESLRVLRGGSFACGAAAVRCAARRWGIPARRFRFRGFRCVLGLP